MMKFILPLVVLQLVLTVHVCSAGRNKKGSDAEIQRVERVTEPCEALSMEESTNMRAYGTAVATIEKVARNEALRNARNELAQMIKIAVDGAAKSYETDVANTLSGSVMTQFVMQNIESTKAIKWSIYDLSDGTIQACVCVEMLRDKDESKQLILDILNADDVLGNKESRDYFVGQLFLNIEEYRTKYLQE